jgi:hypothetical protein
MKKELKKYIDVLGTRQPRAVQMIQKAQIISSGLLLVRLDVFFMKKLRVYK